MLVSVDITDKSFGNATLYHDLHFAIQDGEKIGLIGRNGTGKSTLLSLISGADKDYVGEIVTKKGITVISSRQEHYGFEDKPVLEYIQGDLPEYARLTHVIDTYPETMGDNPKRIQEFSDALTRFGELEYYNIEDELNQAFEKYQLDPGLLHRDLGTLSGGQRRMIELIKVQRSRGQLVLIDEPTNHMDYVAKEAFLKWLNGLSESALIVTHDRDVLSAVDRIIEIRDGQCFSFRGNYAQYLRTNANQTTNQINEYDLSLRRLSNLEEDLIRFRRLKEKSRTPGTIKRFKSLEERTAKEITGLRQADKPSFWIDQESTAGMNDKLSAAYDKHRAKNIRLSSSKPDKEKNDFGRQLLSATKLSLGYGEQPLFEDIQFMLYEGGRLRLHGRNGAGKSTIVQAILSTAGAAPLTSKCFAGTIQVEQGLSIGIYEQELQSRYLALNLTEAIELILEEKDQQISQQRVKQLMGDYLFNPQADAGRSVASLSGGQKARLQLISMLCNHPSLLILDEPTNHLDLPSIEELEHALDTYHGGIIYISHDSYFAQKIGGDFVMVQPTAKP